MDADNVVRNYDVRIDPYLDIGSAAKGAKVERNRTAHLDESFADVVEALAGCSDGVYAQNRPTELAKLWRTGSEG